MYRIVKAVPNLFYASKLLAQQRMSDSEVSVEDMQTLRPVSNLGADELHVNHYFKFWYGFLSSSSFYWLILTTYLFSMQAIECIYLLLCNLTHMTENFLVQFCDAVVMLDGIALLQQLLLLGKRKPRIVVDLLAILTHILRILPEHAGWVEQVVLGSAQGENFQF